MEDKERDAMLRWARDLALTAHLTGVAYLEARKRAREAMVWAVEAGCSQADVARGVGVTKQRVKQVLDQEERRKEMSPEDYDKLLMAFPAAGLTSKELLEWAADQDIDAGGEAGRAPGRRRVVE